MLEGHGVRTERSLDGRPTSGVRSAADAAPLSTYRSARLAPTRPAVRGDAEGRRLPESR